MKKKTKGGMSVRILIAVISFLIGLLLAMSLTGCNSVFDPTWHYEHEKTKREIEEREWEESKERWDIIFHGQLKAGMSKSEVMDMLGTPHRTNVVSGPWGTRTQWVYRDRYGSGRQLVYFDDGKLAKTQLVN